MSGQRDAFTRAKAPNILIMTATVTPPPDCPGLVRLEAATRMGDYRSALSFYLRHLGKGIDNIIFVENSGSDISVLRELVAKEGQEAFVHFHVYNGLNYPPSYGRCYGELRLLDEIMSTGLVAGFPADAVFWKVTGRYKVINLRSMISNLPIEVDFYCDMRNSGQRPWFDMRFMAWTRDGYEAVLRGIWKYVREDNNQLRPGEEMAFKAIKPRLHNTRSCSNWVREPRIDGFRAYDGQNWIHGRQLLVYWLRNLQRRTIGRPIL